MLADAALDAGGEVIGVIPGEVFKTEVAHTKLTKLHVVGSMHRTKSADGEDMRRVPRRSRAASAPYRRSSSKC